MPICSRSRQISVEHFAFVLVQYPYIPRYFMVFLYVPSASNWKDRNSISDRRQRKCQQIPHQKWLFQQALVSQIKGRPSGRKCCRTCATTRHAYCRQEVPSGIRFWMEQQIRFGFIAEACNGRTVNGNAIGKSPRQFIHMMEIFVCQKRCKMPNGWIWHLFLDIL